MVRIDKKEKERMKILARAEGFKSVSDWARYNLLHPSLEMKMNLIIKKLNEMIEKH